MTQEINPWVSNNWANTNYLEDKKFVLEGDIAFIQKYQDLFPNELQLQLVPEQYLGTLTNQTKLVILMGNPGYTDGFNKKGIKTIVGESDFLFDTTFIKFMINQLSSTTLHCYLGQQDDKCFKLELMSQNDKFPNPCPFSYHPGRIYWKQKLEQLKKIGLIENPNDIFEMEFFPYHSINLDSLKTFLNKNPKNWEAYEKMASTQFLKRQILKAIEMEKPILLCRMTQFFFKLVPNLKEYDKLFVLKDSQGANITANNIIKYSYFNDSISILKNLVK